MQRAFWTVAAALGVTMLGTTLPTPLYPLMQQRLGFDELTITVLYAIYAAGVLAALVLFGRASDAAGRRPVLLAGLGCAAVSALAFLSGTGLGGLLVGRVLSGLSAGLVAATATAALIEREPEGNSARAALVATVVNTLGLGIGPLLSGTLSKLSLAPLVSPFLVHLTLIALVTGAVWWTPQPPAEQERIRFRIDWPALPEQVRSIFPAVATVMFTCFAMFGLVTAIEPAFLSRLLHEANPLVSGAAVFAMFACSAISQIATRHSRTRPALLTGCTVVLAGVAGFAVALATESAALMVASTALTGAGQGMAFRAAVATISARAPVNHRSGTMSSFFLVVYLGISVPVIAAGYAAGPWGLRAAGIGFTGAVALLLTTTLIASTKSVERKVHS